MYDLSIIELKDNTFIYDIKNILIICLSFLPLLLLSQTTEVQEKHTKEDKIKVLKWLKETTEKGIEMTEDSIKYSKEFIRVLKDKNYRALLYPNKYNWGIVPEFIKHKRLKPVFWYFINLYPENATNKEIVLKSILAYDKIFKMDEMLVNTFYTYSFMDPEISIIKDGKPEIIHPDILEAKLRDVKEMVNYIRQFKETEKK
jgi:hypothetical protein